MEKACGHCGHLMHVHLRKIVYMNHTEIEHVPVYRCSCCEHHELVEQVKEELKKFLLQVPREQGPISFADYSPFTRMMLRACCRTTTLQADDWLDMYLLVSTLHDSVWLGEIEQALRELQM
ncbi:hypothetical protein DFP93_11636 [Aneurinibacillus soli]|uniref:Uncharacterized protein n=1 Tax=Aneurinibacillus soli TaxID=1500254 RepID=A0A0U5B3U7_9BACL|nr:hypothetical protein [Aneurinibacillus soli]PYE59669.1 hypothetical protein DFP93_11636 [Aneurinibacillus soli]BAU29330.1 hypothetical protein CB4_03517 [Aneurinibacillus soli]